MPVDHALPPPRLPLSAGPGAIAHHFPAAFGVRVDADDLPPAERPGLAAARLPDPAEARLLNRVLQCVPPASVNAAPRLLIVDSGVVGLYGSYRAGIVRVYTPALRLSGADPRTGRRFSFFTTTVLHEVGHAVCAQQLTAEQRAQVTDQYLTALTASGHGHGSEGTPTERGAQHYFVDLFVAAALRLSADPLYGEEMRELLRTLGLRLR